MKLFFSAFLCFTLTAFLSAQTGTIDNGLLRGQLIDLEGQEPIGFANVSVYTAEDSLVTGTISDVEGRFSVENLPLDTYTVKVTFLGYATAQRTVTLNLDRTAFELGVIALGPDGENLDEVVVTAERAVMQLGLDRKVFNVEKSVAAVGGSAEDLLRQIPSVTVDLEGNISLRGSGNIRFLINGKPSGLTGANQQTFLQSLAASNIQRIEVITNPGAGYDPDGTGGLINIVLKNRNDEGFNAGINLNAGSNNKYDGSLDLNWRKGQFNTFAGISGRYDERFFRGIRSQEGIFADTSFSRLFNYDGNRIRRSMFYKAGTEWFFNEKGSIQLQGSYQNRTGDNTNLRTTTFFDDTGALDRTSFRDETEPGEESDYEIRADFRQAFATEGRQLSGTVQFSNSQEAETENYLENNFSGDDIFLGEERQQSPTFDQRQQFLAQMDYEHKVDEFKFEVGWRSTIQRLENDSKFNVYDYGSASFTTVDSASNLFFYDEDIHAMYSTFGGKMGDFVFSAGLRAELALTQSRLAEPVEENFTNNYFKLYPSVFLGYEVSEGNTLQFSYSRRINRPRSRSLNPFVDRGDPLNLRSGNPFLLPELINSFELNLQHQGEMGSITGGFYYRQLNDLISRITRTLPGGISLSTRDNLDRGRNYGVEVISSYRPTKKLDLTLSVNAYRSEIVGELEGADVDANGYLMNASLQGSYDLPANIQTQFTYFYRSPGIRPQGRIRSIQSLDIGFRKPILQDKGALTLRVSDVFNQRRFQFDTEVTGLVTTSTFQRESRIVYLGFQYSLRQQKGRRDRNQRRGGGGDGGGEDF